MVAMCSELMAPRPLHMIPFLVLTVVAQYSARPSTSQSGQELGRGWTPMFERIWWAPSWATVCGFKQGRHLGLDRVALGFLEEEDAVGEVLVVSADLGVDAACGRGSRFSVAKITATSGNSDSWTGTLFRRKASIKPR